MKKLIFYILNTVFFISCVSSLRIIEVEDQYKKSNKMKLSFDPKSFSDEKAGELVPRKIFNVNSSYLYEETTEARPEITLDFRLITPVSNKEMDSVMYLNLDGEKIKLISKKYQYKEFEHRSSSTTTSESAQKTEDGKSTETSATTKTTSTVSNYQLMNRIFVIPENLWISIARSEKIQYRLYFGDEGIDVIPTYAQTRKLKYFYELAIFKRDAKYPLVPEGKMKW
ncbi:MAG: hypothetical protein WAO52_07290 [Prolixibacteraceae bacterium]